MDWSSCCQKITNYNPIKAIVFFQYLIFYDTRLKRELQVTSLSKAARVLILQYEITCITSHGYIVVCTTPVIEAVIAGDVSKTGSLTDYCMGPVHYM